MTMTMQSGMRRGGVHAALAAFAVLVLLAGCKAISPPESVQASVVPPPPAVGPAPEPDMPPPLPRDITMAGSGSPAIANSGYSFLPTGVREQAGFGLYSYLLLTNHSPDSDSAYKLALTSLLQWLRPIGELKTSFSKKQLNNTHILVNSHYAIGQEGVTDKDVAWLTQHADIARALQIASYLRGVRGHPEQVGGPYIVTYYKPLSDRPDAPGRVLITNLAGVKSSRDMQALITAFIFQVQERDYAKRLPMARVSMALDRQYRRLCAVLDVVRPGVKSAITDLKDIQ